MVPKIFKDIASLSSHEACTFYFDIRATIQTIFFENVLKTGIHEHTFTCKKPPQGFHHCRTGKPSGDSHKTQPVFLEIEGGISKENLQDKVLTKVMPTVMVEPPQLLYNNLGAKLQRDFARVPIIPPPNDELFVWEFKRPLLELSQVYLNNCMRFSRNIFLCNRQRQMIRQMWRMKKCFVKPKDLHCTNCFLSSQC